METVHILSFTQPFASLVILHEKLYATRGWQTAYRGTLVIHAAKTFPAWAKELCEEEPCRHLLIRHRLDASRLPLGKALGTVCLDDCLPTEDAWERLPVQELQLGDYSRRRFAFRLSGPRPFRHPVPVKGQLRIFTRELAITEDWYVDPYRRPPLTAVRGFPDWR